MPSHPDGRRFRRLVFRACGALLLDRVNLTFRVVLNREWIKVPTLGRIGYSNLLAHEPWMVHLVQRLLPLKSGAFIDVGVNLGQTLIRVRCADRDVRYVGFEPNPACVYYVNHLIEVNGFKGCTVVPVGLSNESAFASLGCYGDETDASATMVKGFREQAISQEIFVSVQELDLACEQLNLRNVSVLKIDVEGGELEVIQGARRVLADIRPFILCEILPAYSSDNAFRTARQEALEGIMKAANYSICRIEKDKRGRLCRLTPMERIGIHSDLSLCDYLFVPNELEERVTS